MSADQEAKKPRRSKSAPVPPPQDPTKVKHGCCSCTHYLLPVKSFPCSECKDWNYWTDASPSSTNNPKPGLQTH